ncbi:MAG TPA: tripartite tricarboxylate transporter substrate binding protein [Roseomonas sp.]|jgi:tripartite-type tricarboxylate transporter receptor subunit TctC
MPITRRAALALPVLAAPAVARGQPAWRPTQPVRIIVPAAPAGTADLVARVLAAFLQQHWHGVSVVVENRSGAGGLIGTQEFLRAPADGHTILSGNIGPQAIAYSLYRNTPYRVEQLLPVAGVVRGPNVLVVHPSVPAHSLPELVAHLKRNPGRISYGSPGVGQSPHLTGVWFNQAVGTESIHVPYRGAGPAMVELVAGNIQYMWDNLTSGIQQVRAGTVRALAVSTADRNAQLPDVPAARETMAELAQFDVSTWFGMFYAAGVPAPAVQALNEAMRAMDATEDMKQRIAQIGGVSLHGTPEAFAGFVRAEIEKWRGVITREGLQLDAN